MTNPILCEVTRGGLVESRHRGAVAVLDADGGTVLSLGDIERPVYPRSAVKAIQALPMLESGAAAAFHFGNREMALASASHAGTTTQVHVVRSMLDSAGLEEGALECGTHWPNDRQAAAELIEKGLEPGPAHNNCSGKHTGFLCTCVHLGIPTDGYVRRDHAIQRLVTDALESVTGAAHTVDCCAVDGCSIPTHAVPLENLALGFARFATGRGLPPERAKAAERLIYACTAEPTYVDGEDRPCTKLLQAGFGLLFAKNGAEGVYCGAIPEQGLGIAVKCEDGADRAAFAIFAATAAKLLDREPEIAEGLRMLATRNVLNRKREPVGVIRPHSILA